MTRLFLTLALAFTALPGIAAADRALSIAEFEAMVVERTLTFDRRGRPFGSEQYFADKRVIWAFENGQCEHGIWFENTRGEICFVYESNPAPQCWTFVERAQGGHAARAVDSPIADELVVTGSGTADLDCPLPDLGV